MNSPNSKEIIEAKAVLKSMFGPRRSTRTAYRQTEHLTNMNADEMIPCSAILQTLRNHLPAIAKLLDTQEENLFVMSSLPCRSHMQTADRDICIRTAGLQGVPFIPFNESFSQHGKHNQLGYGFHLYETKGDETSPVPMRYVLANFPSPAAQEAYYIVRKGQVSHLIRYFKRMRIKSLEAIPPILHDGILEDILRNSVTFLRSDEIAQKYGVKLKRGLVFNGDPGNGKTMACRYIREMAFLHGIEVSNIRAGELDAAYARGNLDEYLNMDGIIFLDDIDVSFFSRRDNGKMACALLSALDGMEQGGKCVRIFTTNEKISDMDSAFKRPGRIDKIFTFEKPNEEMRTALFAKWPKEIQEAVKLDRFIEATEGFSFAECESVKTVMVTNHVMKELPWDFEVALQDHNQRAGDSFTPKSAGFHGQ